MARVTDEEASSVGMADGQVLVSLPMVLVRGDVPLNVLDLHSAVHRARRSLPISLSPVIWRDAEAVSPGLQSQRAHSFSFSM